MKKITVEEEVYKISVCENLVAFDGTLTIEEMFDWLNYFDKKGFNYVCTKPNDSIFLVKKPPDDVHSDEDNEKCINEKEVLSWLNCYDNKDREKIKKKIIELYALVDFLKDCTKEEKIDGMAETD